MIIKICGITNLEDALAAAEAGVDALGFNFYPRSPRYLTPEAAAAITAALPERVQTVGVFVNETRASIENVAETVGLNVAQLHGHESRGDAPASLPTWKAFSVTSAFSADEMLAFPAEAYVLDAPAGVDYGGTGRTFDWKLIPNSTAKVILAGGLGPANVEAAIQAVNPWGVDACSRLELTPGRKDHRKMLQFIAAARQAEHL